MLPAIPVVEQCPFSIRKITVTWCGAPHAPKIGSMRLTACPDITFSEFERQVAVPNVAWTGLLDLEARVGN